MRQVSARLARLERMIDAAREQDAGETVLVLLPDNGRDPLMVASHRLRIYSQSAAGDGQVPSNTDR